MSYYVQRSPAEEDRDVQPVRYIYRAVRTVPLIGGLANFLLRQTRKLFWSLRPARNAAQNIPDEYLAFVLREIAKGSQPFTVLEVGCGDGRVLRELARRFPDGKFVGVDIQKAAVDLGEEVAAREGLSNIRLYCRSVLDDSLSWDCDYLISRTALIYLDQDEIRSFLRKRLPRIGRAILAHEIVSLTDGTKLSHFFAHPLAKIAEEVSDHRFHAAVKLLDYQPWKNENAWSGAEIVLARVAEEPRTFAADAASRVS